LGVDVYVVGAGELYFDLVIIIQKNSLSSAAVNSKFQLS